MKKNEWVEKDGNNHDNFRRLIEGLEPQVNYIWVHGVGDRGTKGGTEGGQAHCGRMNADGGIDRRCR